VAASGIDLKGLQQDAEKVPADGKRTLKGRVISLFRRKPESRAFLNQLIFKAKRWAPAFAGVTSPPNFNCKVGISILFKRPAKVAE
jgi:hypothetical protein